MSERDTYPAGCPCWVVSAHPDPAAAAEFYRGLFGWETAEVEPPGGAGSHFHCSLRGRAVAAIGSPPDGAAPAAWGTYMRVDDADAAVAAVAEAGGSVVAEPVDLGDHGRTAVCADPAGAPFGLWQGRRLAGAQRVNEPGAWSISFLLTPDVDGAKAFYNAAFGWETDSFGDGPDAITLWRLPGYVGGEPEQPVPRDVVGAVAPAPADGPPRPPHWSVDFWVDDVDAAVARAPDLGGSVVLGPYAVPVGRQAVLADPQGAAFTVSKVGPDA